MMKKLLFVKDMPSHFQIGSFDNRLMPHAASVFALVYLLYANASIFQAHANDKLKVVEPEQEIQEKSEAKQMDFMLIKDWHLFGQASNLPSQNMGQQLTVQETQLQYKLLGVFFLPQHKKNSYAIIENDSHIQKKYRAGDEMAGGITLQSIAKDRVILLRNQQPEFLPMEKKKTKLLAKT